MANFGGRYELIRRIGAGGMGEVWLAHDEQLAGRPVAIKIMHSHLLANSDDVARFEREARIAAQMDHPNIVTVYTTGNFNGAPFMVMEYLRGQDLEKALPRADAERVVAIGRDICGALAYAHGQGVIHRDIKPGNLFLCDTGQVKVTDFGIARAASGTTLSTAGVLVGTFAYMPPEQWRGAAPAFSNDIWAVGCVLYRLISGRLPRLYPDAAGYAAAATRGDPVPDLRDVGGAPAWLTAAVMAMLDPDPASRPTAGDCVRLLSGLPSLPPASGWPGPGRAIGTAGQPPATVAMTRPAATRATAARSWRPGRVIAVTGGAVALLLAGSLIGLRFHGSPQSQGTAAGGTSAPATRSAAASPATSAEPSRPASPTTSAPALPASSPTASRAATPTAGATVNAPASTGAPLVPVPDVVGMTFTKARLVLIGDGFRVVGRHPRFGQTVTATSPSGEAPAGSVIIVVYGTGL